MAMLFGRDGVRLAVLQPARRLTWWWAFVVFAGGVVAAPGDRYTSHATIFPVTSNAGSGYYYNQSGTYSVNLVHQGDSQYSIGWSLSAGNLDGSVVMIEWSLDTLTQWSGMNGSYNFGQATVWKVRVRVQAPWGSGVWEERTFPLFEPVADKEVLFTLPANESGVPVHWKAMQDGQVVGEWIQAPGAAPTLGQILTGSSSPVSLTGEVRDMSHDGMNWIIDGGSATPVASFPPVTPGSSGSPATGGGTTLPEGSTPPPVSPPTTGGGTVWNNPASPDAATNQTLREASDKITGRLDKIWERQGTTNAKLDGLQATAAEGNEKLDEISEKLTAQDENAKKVQQLETEKPTVDSMKSAAASAGEAAGDLVEQVGGRSYTVNTAAPSFTFSMLGYSINWDPFTSERFGPIASWAKGFLRWLCVILFGHWCVVQASSLYGALAGANQARGNTFAGSGGQITAFINAGLISAAALVCIAVVWAFSTSDFGAGSLLSVAGADPFAGIPGGVAYCLDKVFPLAAMAGYFVGRLVWAAAAQAAVVTASTVIRFFVA